jgi:demethylmenaquinone methyltransferase/2-methoxy-6-polyprenyl-1,4-benzoquinol methylase
VFASFALELFDEPEIPKLLAEAWRVLKPTGRIGVLSLSKAFGSSALLRLYEWFHRKFPQSVDCRPIYLERSLGDAGYGILFKERVNILGLPGEIVIGTKST